MNIYLLDRNLRVCDTLNNEGDAKSSPFFNDEYIQYLETGAETFEFETLESDYLENGNYVAFSYKNDYKLFQISEIEDTHEDNLIKKVYCEVAGLELTYEIMRPRIIASANIKQFMSTVLSDTSWEVGYIDENITDTYTIEIDDYEKIYDLIQEYIKKYQCEISFRVTMKNATVTHKYVDVFKQRGSVTDYRFEYGKNVNGITRKVNSFDLCTAIIGTGKDGQTFKDAEWSISNGNPADKPLNQDFLVDEMAFKLYNNNGSHLMGYFKCDLESPYDILAATYKELQERKQPKVEYEVNISLFDIDDVELGDEVYVIDNEWKPEPLLLSARVNELHVSFTDSSENKCVMSNFKKVKSKITSVDEILNRIPETSSFMGISKGGLLSSNIEVDGFNVKISNKIVDKNGLEYYVNLTDKKYSNFMNDILPHDPRYITQSFAMDFDEGCIYTSQVVTETNPEHILISKIRMSDKKVLGYMRLHGFGHGSQIGIDKLDGVTKIWCECYGEPHITTGKLFGTKICRFTFENGKEYTTSAGNVFDMVTDARNIQVSVSEQSNRLSIKYITYSNKNAINVYDLKSVIDNNPKMLASFTIPSWLETSISPNQGHSVYGNRVYHYQGGDSTVNGSKARVTVFDFSGRVIDSNVVLDNINFSVKEPEGLFIRENNGIYELYAGLSEGAWPNRKYHIYKFSDSLDTNYEKRGVFTHNNGYVCNIEDALVKTQFDGSQRRKYYLLFTDRVGTNFIVANFKGGKWWVNSEEYSPGINDAVIAELVEESNRVKVFPLVTEVDSVKGADGQNGFPGADATFLELSNEFHSIPTDSNGNNGIYSGCETELKLYKGDILLTDNVSYKIKNSNNITGRLESNKYIVTNISADTGYVDLAATYSDKEYIKRFSVSKNKQGLGGEDGLTPTVYWLMTSTSTISKDSKGNLKPSSVTFWAKSQTGEDSVVNYQGIFKIYESVDGNTFTLKHTSELDDTVPYTPSSTAQSIKCELYLNDGTTLIDQDIVNIVKDGTDGFSGADAKYVLLTGEQIFKYTNNFTGTPTPSSITLTGTPFNISSSNVKWYYKKSSDTNYTLISANNGKMEITLNHNDSTLFANNNKVVTIKFDIDGYYDEMTIAKISDGSSGSDGEDGYFVLLTNENHTVPCENDGTVVNGELKKAKTEIHVFKGTQEVSFSLSKTDVGCTSTYDSSTKTLSITSLTSKAATVTMQITVNGTVFTKVMTISKATKGDTGEDSYTVDMTNDNYSFNCDAKGNIASVITTTTVITAFKGVNPVVPTIGTLPTVAGLTLSKSNGIITIKANTGTSLADNGSFDIPVTVGGNNFIKTFSWTKVKNGSNGSNGVSVTSTDVEYTQSSSSTTAPTTGWTTTAPTWQNGKYIWSRTKTILSDGTTKYTNPACITGQQGNSGVGVSSIVEYYKVHTSNTGVTNETSGFTTTMPTMTSTNKYLWNYELITYTNGATEKTSARVIGMFSKDGTNGTNGSDGKGITSITNYYLASSSGSGVTTSTSGWTTTIQNVSTSKKYLWNYEVINYTTGSPTTTNPVIIGVYGDTGATGTGITSITEEYYLSTSKTTQTEGSWVTTPPTWSVGKYMWTRSKIVYSNPTSTVYTTPVCDSSWEAVNDIQIGGRNLLTGCGQYTQNNPLTLISASKDGWKLHETIITSMELEPGEYMFQAQTDGTWSSKHWTDGTADPAKKLCTLWLYNVNTDAQTVYYFNNNNPLKINITNKSKYRLRTNTYSDGTTSITVKMWNFKLEKSNKATDWTPAPEDVEKEISDVSNSLGTLEGSIKDAFGDGIINDSEARALASNIQILDNEKSDLDKEYSTVYNNANLGGSAKTNLNNAKTEYDSTHTSLISSINTAIVDKIITDSERNSVNSFFSTYRTKLQTLRQRLQEANDYISTNKVDNIQIGGRNLYLDTKEVKSSKWNNLDQWNTDEIYKGFKVFSRTGCWMGLNQDITFEVGKPYTLSVWVKGDGNADIQRYFNGNGDWIDVGGFEPWQTAPTEWTRIYVVFKCNDTTFYAPRFENGVDGATLKFYGFKLEEGNKPTAWTPAPEDTTQEIQDKLDDMDIGVTNIIRNSRKPNTKNYWTYTPDNCEIIKANGIYETPWGAENVFSILNETTSEMYFGTQRYKLEGGATYTFSAWFYIEPNVTSIEVYLLCRRRGSTNDYDYVYSPVNAYYEVKSKWLKLTGTVVIADDVTEGYIRIDNNGGATNGGRLWFTKIKLEKGNKATDWTPATEDVDSAIGENIKTVDVMYYLSTSQTSLSGGSWQTTAPTWVNGKYMWSKTVTTLANGTVKESSPTCIAGAKGETGSAGKGVKSIVEQYYLSTSQTSLSGGSWSTTVPTWQQGKYIWTRSVITYTDNTTTTTNGICVSGSKGDKGDAGTNGTNGVNGTSPVLVTITGQQSMKYLDRTTAPVPSTITLTTDIKEGSTVVSSGATYIWQYKNSSGTWVNLSGTYTGKTYSLAYNNTGFINEVAQIRAVVSYKSNTYYAEHTVTKIYDNKYISKQEVFDKITEGGTNQLIYKDPSTGEIYMNITFAKTGQLIADLIKGGILTLGGTGNSDTGDYGRFRILDSTGQNELASMDGGEMRMVNLQAEELNATDLNVKNINCVTYAPAIYEYTKVYVNTTSGNDDVDFESGAVFKTLQGALDSAPKNLNGFTTEIVLQTAVSENIVIRGFSGGTLNILMNSKNINGYVVARDCSAQVFILGGLTTSDIPDGINNTGLRPNIQPSQLFSFGGYNYSFVAIGCAFVYVRSVDIFGKTGTTTNYCGGSVNGSNVYVQNVNAYASNSGWNVTTGGKMTTKETYGRCERLAYNVQLGGVAHICNGNSTGAPSNIYTGNGGQVIQGNVTFVGSGDVGSNNNTTTNNTSIVLNANYGDSYKVKYSSWRKDNSVRQGDWSSTGMNKGCWFFGNQFVDLKGKTIKSVKLTLQRQSGGNSGAVAFTLKMHNHTGRPSGLPSYLSEWSKNISLTVGQSTTITITDSAVLTAIKNGTMKGFGIEVSSASNSYYGILTPKLKAVVTY